MTALTYTQANDEMFGRFDAAWTAGAGAIVGGATPEIRWPGLDEPAVPPTDKYWSRVSVQTVKSDNVGFSVAQDNVGNDKRKITTHGLIFVQLFGPRANDDSMPKLRQLAELAKTSFLARRNPHNVIFRNVRINELPPEPSFQRINVVSETEYDEIV